MRLIDEMGARDARVAVSRRSLLQGVGSLPAALLVARPAVAQTTDPGIYFDSNQLIVQRDQDGGDTAQREGWAWSGIKLRQIIGAAPWNVNLPLALPATLDLLELNGSGRFRRHPTQSKWSNPDAFSRDQATGLTSAMALAADRVRLHRTWNALTDCNLILKCVQGTADVAGPDFINLYRRGFGEEPDPNGDAFLFLGVANRIAQASQSPDDVGDDVNLVLQLCVATAFGPTTASEQARALYGKNRPVGSGCYLSHYRAAFPGDFTADEATMQARIKVGIAKGWKPDCPRVLGALRWYFRAESGGCSSLAELYEPIVNHWLS